MRSILQNQAKRTSLLRPCCYGIMLACLGIIPAQAAGQEEGAAQQTSFFFEIRERLEYQENFNDKFYGTEPKVGDASDTYLLSRIRLGLSHRFTEELSGKISIQDSRAMGWGLADEDWKNSEFGGIINNPQADPLELGETWLQYAAHGLTVRGGHQLIGYGNSRVFASSDWKNSGKWVWDAVRMGYKRGGHWLAAFYGESMLHDPDVFSLEHRHGYTGGAVYGHVQARDFLAIEPLLASKKNDSSNDYQEKELYYYGARLLLDLNGFTGDTTFVQQTGEITASSGGSADVDAYGYNLDLMYRLTPQWALGTSFSYATGDDKSTAENERFDGVYGASDKFYGLINLMSWSNMLDYGAVLHYRPKKGIELQAEYHQFYADEINDKWCSYTTGLDADSDSYGNEIDLVVRWKLNPDWKLRAGASAFFPGDAIKEAVAREQDFLTDDIAYAALFQLTYTFTKGRE